MYESNVNITMVMRLKYQTSTRPSQETSSEPSDRRRKTDPAITSANAGIEICLLLFQEDDG
jgi:hypothetical protein